MEPLRGFNEWRVGELGATGAAAKRFGWGRATGVAIRGHRAFGTVPPILLWRRGALCNPRRGWVRGGGRPRVAAVAAIRVCGMEPLRGFNEWRVGDLGATVAGAEDPTWGEQLASRYAVIAPAERSPQSPVASREDRPHGNPGQRLSPQPGSVEWNRSAVSRAGRARETTARSIRIGKPSVAAEYCRLRSTSLRRRKAIIDHQVAFP